MSSAEVDYSLYLVTDSTPAVLGNKDLVAVVKAAVEGGRFNLHIMPINTANDSKVE